MSKYVAKRVKWVKPKVYIIVKNTISMPMIYLKNDLYKRIVKSGRDVSSFVEESVEEKAREAGF